jgi:hypothetical protein
MRITTSALGYKKILKKVSRVFKVPSPPFGHFPLQRKGVAMGLFWTTDVECLDFVTLKTQLWSVSEICVHCVLVLILQL